jgi:hypothetical protein
MAGILCLALVAHTQPEVPVPSAQALLDDVVARLPRDPLNIKGDLTVRRRRGVVVRRLKFEMFLQWGSTPSVARYTIRDAFGSDLEQLTVIRAADRARRFEYAQGNPLTAGAPPSLFGSIQSTDISWMDLALDFLWWKGGKVLQSDEVRGRSCYVVEVPAPADACAPRPAGTGDGAADTRYAKVRLWIDKELHMLLRAQGMDGEDKPVRELWVKSFKKIDDRWMIKDMEIQRHPVVHRTKLTIGEMGVKKPL